MMNARIEYIPKKNAPSDSMPAPVIKRLRMIDFIDTAGAAIRFYRENNDEYVLVAQFVTSQITSLEITD